jgi:hypothetical protein
MLACSSPPEAFILAGTVLGHRFLSSSRIQRTWALVVHPYAVLVDFLSCNDSSSRCFKICRLASSFCSGNSCRAHPVSVLGPARYCSRRASVLLAQCLAQSTDFSWSTAPWFHFPSVFHPVCQRSAVVSSIFCYSIFASDLVLQFSCCLILLLILSSFSAGRPISLLEAFASHGADTQRHMCLCSKCFQRVQ